VFWLKLNQRFHRLYPENETFVSEIEKEIFNEAPAHLGENGVGIRYFSNLNGVLQNPGNIGTCCEGQGSRLYGSLYEYLYSFPSDGNGIYINLYTPSTVTFTTSTGVQIYLVTETNWPYSSDVKISVYPKTVPVKLDIAFRIPEWITTNQIPINRDNSSIVNANRASYTHIVETWTDLDSDFAAPFSTFQFSLPMNLQSHLYTGVTQIGSYRRYGFTFGPILLAAIGPWNSDFSTIVLKGLDPENPSNWMQQIPNSLNFTIKGTNDYMFIPHGEVKTNQYFSVYPVFMN